MKKNKFSYVLLISLLVMMIALMSVAIVACNKNKTPQEPKDGPESGVYYYDAGDDEYTVILGAGNKFSLAISDVAKQGSYTLKEDVLTLKPNKKDENQISAILKDNVITLTYDESEFRFLKKVNYTVTFDSNAGSDVDSATVVNGKKVAKPADPTREGYIFVGWYKDAGFSAPFSFNSQIITADTIVVARWVEKKVGQVEFIADFNANNGSQNPASKATVGGKLFDLPVVEREGYTFNGWWVSMNGDDTLSYRFTDGMSLDADVTLHALWQQTDTGTKLPAPVVNVDANSVSWNAVGANVKEYSLQIQGPDGNNIVSKSVGGTVEAVSFADYPAGDYIITVTAVAMTGEANNAVATRLYKNKALTRVSQFSVIEPSMLLFGAVDNADKYLITVDCGDKNHKHVNFDNGNSTHFNFSDCMMQNSGIKFTVTAIGDGYASSVSKQFVYAPKLDAVTDFALDEQTQKLVWNEVENATGYMVSVKCGNDAHSDKYVDIGAINSIDLKECANCEGGIVVKVYPVSRLYISPEAAEFKFNKQNLATPSDIRIQGTVVSWAAVKGATSYDVNIAGRTVSTNTNSVDLAGKVSLAEKADYTITIIAKGESNSLATDPIDARNLAMADKLKYENSVLSWPHVIGAAFYDVQINDQPAFSVTDGANFAAINLSKAGENTLKVRFVNESGAAFEWVSTTVYAHTLTFVSDGGSSIEEQYKAIGDEVVLPTPQKQGYDFLDWYNTPRGPESNGAAFKESAFKASGDLVLYACYTSKAYTVTYHYGDGGNGAAVSESVYYQKDYKLTVPQANEATSAFGGWFSAPNGNGVQYTDDKGNSMAPWNRTGNADVYAFWFDDVLNFTLTNNAGKPMYAVIQGSRISQVSEVTVPSTYKGVKVGMLSGNAFKGCSNLVTINIPDTIELISAVDPFTDCTSLQAVNVYETEGNNRVRYWSSDGVLFDNGSIDSQPSDPSQINAVISFMPLGKTGSYRIPDGISEIPSLAFAGSQLSRVVVPSSVNSIGIEAFKDCVNLDTIVFDTGSTHALTIADGAFANCTALTTINLPARLSSIALTKYELLRATGTPATQEVSLTTGVTNAFVGCKNLENIIIDKGNKVYSSENGIIYSADRTTLFYGLSTVKGDVVIPTGVTRIADGAFIGCNSITSITIPNTVTAVGECAFYNTDLTGITFKGNGFNDVTIGKYAFRACDELTSVVFEAGNRVAYIGEGAFLDCDDSDFERIELPANLKSIGVQAFRNCSGLKEIVISATNSDLTFGSDAFYNCNRLQTLNLPKTVTQLPGVFSGCTSLKEVVVDPENPYFTSVDGVLFDKNKTVILFYPQNKNDSEYELPATLTTISDGVFRGNSYLESITIGKNVSKIGNDAFRDCDLTSVVFESGEGGATSLEIGAYAFYHCNEYYMKSIALPDRTTKVGEYAFAEMKYLNSFTFNEGLEGISDYMFYNDTRLTVLEIPASVQTIGEYAFYCCGYMPDELSVTFAANSKLVSIGESAFESSYGYDETVELPQGLQHIGYRAFYNAKFDNYIIPNTVKVIGAEAFASSSVKTVTFAAGGTDDLILGAKTALNSSYAEGNVFRSCSGLEEISLPERLTFIGAGSFYGCDNLENVSFDENIRLKHIGSDSFNGTVITSLTIPKSVSNGNVVVDEKGTVEFRIGIGESAFGTVHTLETVNFEAGGTEPLSLGDNAFYYMRALTTVNLPSRIADYTDADGNTVPGVSVEVFSSSSLLTNVNVAAGGAFYSSVDGVLYNADKSVLVMCPVNKTGKVVIDSHVAFIADSAFEYSKITEIEFSGGTVDMIIGARAFASCSGLEEVVLSDNVVEIKENAFMRCASLERFTLSANLKAFDPDIFTETNIIELNVSANNKDYSSVNGIVFSKDMKTLISYPTTLTATSYTVPSTVTAIAESAFKKNNNIKTVVLPAGLKKIGEMAFSDCQSLESITIPKTVEIIKKNAFSGCVSLEEIKFEKNGVVSLVIEENAFQNSGLTAIELPATLTSLGASAFYRCGALNEVTFANGSKLDSIGDSAFFLCTSLQSISLPQGLTVIGDNVFSQCTSLKTVEFSEGLVEIGKFTFKKCPALESVSFPASLKKMGVSTFSDDSGPDSSVFCTSLKAVTFAPGSQLDIIPESTFYKCTALERITIPANVTAIEDRLSSDGSFEYYHYGAFQGCTSLKAVIFEEGSKCKDIGDSAFLGCIALETISIPSSVARLGVSAFEKCESIESIVIPSTATVYGKNLFNGCKSLARVTLNEKATALSDGMFAGCESLKQINIPSSVTSFGNNLFSNTGFETFVVPSNITVLPYAFLSGCKALTSVKLPDGLLKIERSAFSGSDKLKAIEIPAGVTTIEESAFANCTGLEEISLPQALEVIGHSVFAGCESLLNIVIPNSVKKLESYTFSNCVSLKTVKLPSSLLSTESSTFANCNGIESFGMDNGGNNNYKVIDGVLYNGSVTAIVNMPASKTGALVLPSTITEIAANAFKGCGITSITLPATMTSIGSYALAGCKHLSEVIILGDVTEIGYYAFADCPELDTIELPDTIQAIADYAFSNCVSLTTLTLPQNLKQLGRNVFYNCTSLQGIVIPNGVSRIEYNTFYGCTDLATVKLPSSLSYMASSAFSGCSSITAYSMDGNGNEIYKIVDGALYSITETSTGVRATLVSVPAGKKGALALSDDLYSVSSVSVLSDAKGLTEYTMTNGGNGKYKVIDGALYTYSQNANNEITSLVLYSVPISKSGTLTLPRNMTGVPTSDYYFILNDCKLITEYIMEDCEGLSYEVVKESGSNNLYEIAQDGTRTKISSGVFRVFDGVLYQVKVGWDQYYYVVDSDVEVVITAPALYKLISVPASKTGAYTVPKMVNEIAASAFKNCKLDLLTFESGRREAINDSDGNELYSRRNTHDEYYRAYTDYCLSVNSSNAWLDVESEIKVIVLSINDFNQIYMPSPFSKLKEGQEIRFKESESDVKSFDSCLNRLPGSTEATVIFDYVPVDTQE